MSLSLIPEFKATFHRLWSVRLGLVAGIFSGLETILPLFVDAVPRGVFAGLSMLAAVGAVVARGIQQEALHGNE